MTDPTQFVKIGGISFLLPAGAKVKTLSVALPAGSGVTVLADETGNAYVIPANKKLWILEAVLGCSSAPGVMSIYSGASGVGTTLLTKLGFAVGTISVKTGKIEVAAGLYINASNNNWPGNALELICIELNV